MIRRESVHSVLLMAALGAALLLARAEEASAQYNGTTGGRRSTGGKDFPSWEGDESSGLVRPLPEAPTGAHDLAWAKAFDEAALGVAPVGGVTVAVALASGRVVFLTSSGEEAGRVELGGAPAFPPVGVTGGVLVALPTSLVLVGPAGVAWSQPLAEPLSQAPRVVPPHQFAVTLSPGRLSLHDVATGAARWTTELPGELGAGPAAAPTALIVGTTDGLACGLDRDTGRLAWQVEVGTRIDGLVVDAEAAFLVGLGHVARQRKAVVPIAARVDLSDGGRRSGGVAWRLRLGAASRTDPALLGPYVAFFSGDGFVHAVERPGGHGGWRSDLPARVRWPPGMVGGRLDFLLEPTGHAVSLAVENGAVMGGQSLPDEDETFVGPSARVGGVTVVATSLGRVLGLRWHYDERAAPALAAPAVAVPAPADNAAPVTSAAPGAESNSADEATPR